MPALAVTALAVSVLAAALGAPLLPAFAGGDASADVEGATLAAPTFTHHPNPWGVGGAEPTLGVNPDTNAVLVQFFTLVGIARFDDSVSPTEAAWDLQRPVFSDRQTLDPYLWTDRDTGRTFSIQLHGACSQGAFTDDDGATWLPMGNACAGADHQSLATGPFKRDAPLPENPVYPNAVYYCAQAIAAAQCALSVDGGITFGPANVVYTSSECGGLHGHPQVASDGTVYLPSALCSGGQGFGVSEDNGVTWDVRTVPGTTGSSNDPSVATAGDRVYYAYVNGNGQPGVAVSTDKGATWVAQKNFAGAGTPHGIRHAVFPAVVAGDSGRAAVAFLGATEPGQPYNADYPGEWHLYVAFTYDGGASWDVVDTTPTDPVQKGGICMGGALGCGAGHRNLLDFMDVTIDAEGRVLVAYADGCVSARCIGVDGTPSDSRADVGAIARQATGRPLYAAFDPAGADPIAPSEPAGLAAFPGDGTVTLAWDAPAWGGDGGLDAYRVYRGADPGALALVNTTSASTFTDTPPAAGTEYTYAVTAVSATGAEGPAATVVGMAATALTETVRGAWTWDGASATDATCDAADDGGIGVRWFNPLDLGSAGVLGPEWNGRWDLQTEFADSGDCAWYHGTHASARAYTPNQDAVLYAQDLPLGDVDSAALHVRLAGSARGDGGAPCAADRLVVETRTGDDAWARATCLTGAFGTLPLAGGDATFTDAVIDVSALAGAWDGDVRLRFMSGPSGSGCASGTPCTGYAVDTVGLVVQDAVFT